VTDTKRPVDPAPDGFLRIAWASSGPVCVVRVGDEPVMAKKAKKRAANSVKTA